MEFASNHGFLKSIDINIDRSVVDYPELKDAKLVMRKVQELEKKAIEDYRRMAKCAMKHGDIETARFMKEIMGDEIKHFDDLAFVNGDTREILGLSMIFGERHND
jgi:ferritin